MKAQPALLRDGHRKNVFDTKTACRKNNMSNVKSRVKGALESDGMKRERKSGRTGKGITVNDWSNMFSSHSINAVYS